MRAGGSMGEESDRSRPDRQWLLLFLCGDVMFGRGIDQVLAQTRRLPAKT